MPVFQSYFHCCSELEYNNQCIIIAVMRVLNNILEFHNDCTGLCVVILEYSACQALVCSPIRVQLDTTHSILHANRPAEMSMAVEMKHCRKGILLYQVSKRNSLQTFTYSYSDNDWKHSILLYTHHER